MSNKQINPVMPPYKFQSQPVITKPYVNPIPPTNRNSLAQPSNVILSPDNLAKNLSELNLEDTEEAASLIFDIVEKDYPK